MTLPIAILLALAAAIIGWLVASAFVRKRFTDQLAEAQNLRSTAEGQVLALSAANSQLRADTDKMSAKADEDFKSLRTVLSNEQAARVKAETELKEASQRLAEERALIDDAQKKLSDTFQALAATSLSANNDAFMKLARTTLDKALTEAKGDLGAKEEAIKGLVTPITASLKAFDAQVRELESKRVEAYAGLEQHLTSMSASAEGLRSEAGKLAVAFGAPHVRGRWGELTLRRAVEVAGMSEHCDFEEQVSIKTEAGRLRPDMIVRLANGRGIAVDSKMVLTAYQSAIDAATEDERVRLWREHAGQVRSRVKELSNKSYWTHMQSAPELVVLFVPAESLFAEAMRYDHTLIEDGLEGNVLIASPIILIALLRAVALGWKQQEIAKNAQAISDLGRKLHERMRILIGYIEDIGKGLKQATDAHDRAVGSMNNRILPAARRFKELGASTGEDMPSLEQIDFYPRALNPPDSTTDSDVE